MMKHSPKVELFLWQSAPDCRNYRISRFRLLLSPPSSAAERLGKEEVSSSSSGRSSMRLDCVAALLIRESRETTARLIRSGLVTVNSAVEESVSFQIHAGDKIAVRGHGKFRISEIGAPTKKDRLHITCQKYI